MKRNLTKRFKFQIIWFFNHCYYYYKLLFLCKTIIRAAIISINNNSYAVYQSPDFGLASKNII